MFFLWLSVPEEVRQAQAATVGLHEGAQACAIWLYRVLVATMPCWGGKRKRAQVWRCCCGNIPI
jgi:hypothetical protein